MFQFAFLLSTLFCFSLLGLNISDSTTFVDQEINSDDLFEPYNKVLTKKRKIQKQCLVCLEEGVEERALGYSRAYTIPNSNAIYTSVWILENHSSRNMPAFYLERQKNLNDKDSPLRGPSVIKMDEVLAGNFTKVGIPIFAPPDLKPGRYFLTYKMRSYPQENAGKQIDYLGASLLNLSSAFDTSKLPAGLLSRAISPNLLTYCQKAIEAYFPELKKQVATMQTLLFVLEDLEEELLSYLRDVENNHQQITTGHYSESLLLREDLQEMIELAIQKLKVPAAFGVQLFIIVDFDG